MPAARVAVREWRQRLRRLFTPRRTIWPTRDGWWSLFAALGLGIAAVNTGNNLLYLLSSMLLGLILVSGLLSEAVMRGLRLAPILPDEIHAGRPVLLGAVLANRKRRTPSCSLVLEALREGGAADRAMYVPWLAAGAERVVTWETANLRRGRRRLPGVRVSTRFPFGVFVKAGRPLLQEEVLVFPAVGPPPAALLREVGSGSTPVRRRGRGADLHNLRDYRAGDDPRLIHWRSSAKSGALTVRELEAETSLDTRIALEGTGARDPVRLEVGLSEAGSLAVHLLALGAQVELSGPGLAVPLGRGRAQQRRILTALALYAPSAAQRPTAAAPSADVREIRIGLGR